MEPELAEIDPHPGALSKKGKTDDDSVVEISDPVCNGESVNLNGLGSVSPTNSWYSCDSPSDMNKSEADTAVAEIGVKTNGVADTNIVSDADDISSKKHRDDLNCLDNREPIVLGDEESRGSDGLENGHCGANSSDGKPAKNSERNSKQNCDTVPGVVEDSAEVSKSQCDDSDAVGSKTGKTESGKPKESENDKQGESNGSNKERETGKSNSDSSTSRSKETESGEAQLSSPRRSTRLSESKEHSPKDENKENMEVVKTPDETPSQSPVPGEGSQNQESVQKASRIARLMENREGGELEDMRPMAGLLFGVGLDLARQQIFKDLIRVQHKKQSQNKLSAHEEEQLNKLKDAFDVVVTKNDAYVQDTLSCSVCNFKTEAKNVMEWHKEFAHDQDSGIYSCSFCDYQDRSPGNFFFHMEAEHNRRGRIYMRSPFYSCPLCPFENNSKASMNKHKMKCERHFKLKRNLEPTPTDCDIPLKRVKKPPPKQPVKKPLPITPQQPPARTVPTAVSTVQSQRPLPPMPPLHRPPTLQRAPNVQRPQMAHSLIQGMPVVSMPGGSVVRQNVQPPVLQPQPGVQQYSLGGGMYTLINNNGQIIMQPAGMPPIPLGQSSMINASALAQSLSMPLNRLQAQQQQKPQQQQQSRASQSATFANALRSQGPRPGTVASELARKKVPIQSQNPQAPPQFEICEICGGFVKDRESLRIHFYWAHKVDIHKDIFSQTRAHLSCEMCPQRFWTYQGLARHKMTKHSKVSNQKRYHCQVCGKRDVENLLQHLQLSHGISLNTLFVQKKCLCCGMVFASRSSLERHLMHTHSDLFKNHPNLQPRQMNKSPVKNVNPIVISSPNSGYKPNPVPTGLYENAIGKKKMYEPFCSICNISFPTIESFKLHCARLHSFKCYRCGQNYSSEEQRFKHFQDTHKNEKEPCQICGEKVIIGRPLIRHMKRCHIKECSVVIQRLPEKKFKFFLKKRQEKLAREMEAMRKRPPIAAKLPVRPTLTPVGKPIASKPIGNKIGLEEVIIIDEEDDKDNSLSKNTSPPGKGPSKQSTSVQSDKDKSPVKALPSPTPGLKEQVMEVDGEEFIIQMQEDEDGNEEQEQAVEDKTVNSLSKEPECEVDQVKEGKMEKDPRKDETKQGQSEKQGAKGKESRKAEDDASDRLEKDSDKDDKKLDEKDPTADAVEILQNMADEIATSTKPMDSNS